jgi:hypothetical protein
MSMQMSKRDTQQSAYLKRSGSARALARMLMPVAAVILATGLWNDPALGPILAEGLEELRPAAARYLVDTPFEDLLGPLPETDLAQDTSPEERITAAAELPASTLPVKSTLPVNRP